MQPLLVCPSTATGTLEKKIAELTGQGWDDNNCGFVHRSCKFRVFLIWRGHSLPSLRCPAPSLPRSRPFTAFATLILPFSSFARGPRQRLGPFANTHLRHSKEAKNPQNLTKIEKYQIKQRVYTNFFESFARTSGSFPVIWVRNPTEIV